MALPSHPSAGEPRPPAAVAEGRRRKLVLRAPGLPEPPRIDEKLPFTAHLSELRVRLLYSAAAIAVAFAFAYWQSERLVAILLAPLHAVMPPDRPVIFTKLTEPFITYLKLSFYSALFFASPVWLTQLWAFVAPGLYEHEKRVAVPLVALSIVAFFAGGSFCYFVAFPLMFRFFLSFQTELLLAAPSIREYLDLTSKLVVAFGVGFEYPVAVLILARMGAVSAAGLRKGRSYAVLAVFLLAAVITPPDLLSQLLFALPMLVLYEIGIWVAAAAGRRRPRRPADEPPDSPHAPPPTGPGGDTTGSAPGPSPPGTPPTGAGPAGAMYWPPAASPPPPAPEPPPKVRQSGEPTRGT